MLVLEGRSAVGTPRCSQQPPALRHRQGSPRSLGPQALTGKRCTGTSHLVWGALTYVLWPGCPSAPAAALPSQRC